MEVCQYGGEAEMEPFLITVNLAIYQIIEHLDKEGVSGNLLDVLNKVFSLFNSISTYTINQGSKIVEEFKDELTETQKNDPQISRNHSGSILGIRPHDEKLKSGKTDFLPAENGIYYPTYFLKPNSKLRGFPC